MTGGRVAGAATARGEAKRGAAAGRGGAAAGTSSDAGVGRGAGSDAGIGRSATRGASGVAGGAGRAGGAEAKAETCAAVFAGVEIVVGGADSTGADAATGALAFGEETVRVAGPRTFGGADSFVGMPTNGFGLWSGAISTGAGASGATPPAAARSAFAAMGPGTDRGPAARTGATGRGSGAATAAAGLISGGRAGPGGGAAARAGAGALTTARAGAGAFTTVRAGAGAPTTGRAGDWRGAPRGRADDGASGCPAHGSARGGRRPAALASRGRHGPIVERLPPAAVRRDDDRVRVEAGREIRGQDRRDPVGARRADLPQERLQIVELLRRVGLPVDLQAVSRERGRARAAPVPVLQIGERGGAPVDLHAAVVVERARLDDALAPVLEVRVGPEPPVDLDALALELGRHLAPARDVLGGAHRLRRRARRSEGEREGERDTSEPGARHPTIEPVIARAIKGAGHGKSVGDP